MGEVMVIRRKLTPADAEATIRELEKWFRDHPRRKVCRTDWFRVGRHTIRKDVLDHTEGGQDQYI